MRDSMKIDDINGTRAKPLYKGIAKDILDNRDIKGATININKVSKNQSFILCR
jgi:hypothetical protein